jgi:glycosyltransferase involved in cell wall biosynthesis
MAPFFSVIVATRDRQALLARTLDALRRQQWPRHLGEIIVADNGSRDATRATVEAAADGDGLPIKYLYVSDPGKSAAVNQALSQARGDIVAFTDDDVVPADDWLARLAEVFEDAGVDFVGGRTLPDWEAPPPAWLSPGLYGVLAVADGGSERVRLRAGVREHPMPIGANMAVRASVVRRVGGLRRDLGKLEGTLRTGEDHELFLRMLHAGCEGVYEPAAVVRHLVPRARLNRTYFRSWLHQNGADVARLEAEYVRGPRVLGVPRYLWRALAADLLTVARAAATFDPALRFLASTRLLWFAGYVRASWPGARHAAAGTSMQPVGGP